MFDNRPKKKSGEYKSTSPDFKCGRCGYAIWPEKPRSFNESNKGSLKSGPYPLSGRDQRIQKMHDEKSEGVNWGNARTAAVQILIASHTASELAKAKPKIISKQIQEWTEAIAAVQPPRDGPTAQR